MRSAVHRLALAFSLLWVIGAAMGMAAHAAPATIMSADDVATIGAPVPMAGCPDCDGRLGPDRSCKTFCTAPAVAILPGIAIDLPRPRCGDWMTTAAPTRGRAAPPMLRPPNPIL